MDLDKILDQEMLFYKGWQLYLMTNSVIEILCYNRLKKMRLLFYVSHFVSFFTLIRSGRF